MLLKGQHLAGTTMSFGLIVTFIAYVQRFNQPISQISVMWTNIQSAIAGGERIFGFLDTVPDLQDGRRRGDAAHRGPGRASIASGPNTFRGSRCCATSTWLPSPGRRSPSSVRPAPARRRLINLIPRFYDVTGGAVTIDGIDVRDVTAATLRAQIGIVLAGLRSCSAIR